MSQAIQVECLLSGLRNTNGDPLSGGLVYTYAVGTTTPKATYTTVTKSVEAANPIVLSSNGQALIFADGWYRFQVKTSAGVLLYDWDYLRFDTTEAVWSGTSGGSANAQTLTPTPAITAYSDGMMFEFLAGYTTTSTTPTANISGKGAKTIVDRRGGALPLGAIQAGHIYKLIYKSVADYLYLMDSYGEVSGQWFWGGTTGGAADAYTITLPSAPTTNIHAGMRIACIIHAQNTGASTITIGALAAITLKDIYGNDLTAGQILATELILAVYDGTYFRVLGKT